MRRVPFRPRLRLRNDGVPPSSHRGRGYVLIFTAGVLFLVSIMVLGIAYSQRLEAQQVYHAAERLRLEYLARGGLTYLLARGEVTQVVNRMGGAVDPRLKDKLDLWPLRPGVYEAPLRAGPVRIELEDIGMLPDANALDAKDWQRLLLLLDEKAGRRVAEQRAEAIAVAKERAARRSGKGGFASIDELLELAELPVELRFGRPGQSGGGLASLFVVGTGSRLLDINRSPLILFRALVDIPEELAQRLAAARKDGKLTMGEMQRLLPGRTAGFFEGDSPFLRARIHAGEQPRVTLSALLRLGDGGGIVISSEIEREYRL